MSDRALRAVADAIAAGRRFLVTSHPRPDGDAIGCTAAMLLALEGRGCDVVAYNSDLVPARFRFLEGAERIVNVLPERGFDTTVLMDCSDSSMFPRGEMSRPDLGRMIVIDHHKTQGDLGDVVLSDPQAASVGVILYRLFELLRVPITPGIAEALYCSVMTDTGSFRYQNTNAEALTIAGRLIEAGVEPWRVSSQLYEERPLCEVDLLARVLQTLEVSSDGRAASLVVTRRMLDETGCGQENVDGFINFARGIRGVEVAILLRPGASGVRVSLRSRGAVDVSRIAQRLGGGGHHNAAGFHVRDSVARIKELLFAQVQTELDAP